MKVILATAILLSVSGASLRATADEPSNEARTYESGAACSGAALRVWNFWSGEYPQPVVQVISTVTLNAVSDVCVPGERFSCSVPAGLYHPWSELEYGYVTVRGSYLYVAVAPFTVTVYEDEREVDVPYPAGTRVEVPTYLSEGLCRFWLPDRRLDEELCPESWTTASGESIFTALPAAKAPTGGQYFRALCAEGRSGWIRADESLFEHAEVIEGELRGWGAVGPATE